MQKNLHKTLREVCHCGLDPQSHKKEHSITKRLRVKPTMTRAAFRIMKTGFSLFMLFAFFSSLLYACASQGRPSGGDYDITPPKFVGSDPEPNTTRFSGNKIKLSFDEYITLEKPNENIIITPPQMQMPTIKGVGRDVTIELKDSLFLNTTYTFDFTNSITDNNEKNVLEGFTFAVSTGDVVDSMIVSGILLNAENLEPMPGILVGLHKNLDDSAFTSIPFNRTSKTSDTGKFWIRNITPGEYRLFALEDQNRNYRYDFPAEALAFEESLVVPSFIPDIHTDTIWKDTLTIDTIYETHYNRFIPDDIVLYYFTDQYTTQYFSKSERPTDRQFILHFNSDEGFPPTVYLMRDDLSKEENEKPWFIREYTPDKKSIIYWITDSLVYQQDTLRMEMNYLAHDSLINLIPHTDTLQLTLRRSAAPKKEKDKDGQEKIEFLGVKVEPSGTIDIFDTLKITFNEPIVNLDPSKLKISQKVDTIWEERSFPIVQDSLNPRLYYIQNQWGFGQEFQVNIDSAEIHSVYGKWNDSLNFKWKIRPMDEYGDIYIKISGNDYNGFGELLNSSDKVVKTTPLINGELIFENVKPAKYYLRYIDDSNENGKWDSGSYNEKKQPEKVYYFESFFEIRKLLEIEHSWNIKAIPRTKQKPLDITKNKPKEKQPKRTNETDKNDQQNNQQNSNSGAMQGQQGQGNQNRLRSESGAQMAR